MPTIVAPVTVPASVASGVSIDCPGCGSRIDLTWPERQTTLPVHPRGEAKTVGARELGKDFPGPCVAIIKIDRPCKWSGALIEWVP